MVTIESTPEMAAKVYQTMERNLSVVRRRLGRALTLADKVTLGHLERMKTLAARLTAQKLADASVFERIQTDVKTEINGGVQFALAAPYPEPKEVDEDVYA